MFREIRLIISFMLIGWFNLLTLFSVNKAVEKMNNIVNEILEEMNKKL